MVTIRKRVTPVTNGKCSKTRKLAKERGVPAKQDTSILEKVIPTVGGGKVGQASRKDFKNCGKSHRKADGVQEEKGWAADSYQEFGSSGETQERLMKSVQELTKCLQGLDDILQKCIGLSTKVAAHKPPESKAVENQVIIKMPLFCQLCEKLWRAGEKEAENYFSGFTHSCCHEDDSGVLEINLDHGITDDDDEGRGNQAAEATLITAKHEAENNLADQTRRNAEDVVREERDGAKKNGSDFGHSTDLQVYQVEKLGGEEEGERRHYDHLMIDNFEPVQDIVVSQVDVQDEKVLNNMDFVLKRCSSELQVEAIYFSPRGLDALPNSAAELNVRNKLAVPKKNRWGGKPFRIRLDGRRWQKKRPGQHGKRTYFTQIKRRYLFYRLLRNSRAIGNLDQTIPHLLKGETDRKMLQDECPENNNTPYEFYSHCSDLMCVPVPSDPGEEEIEDLFREMALAVDRGWENPEIRRERSTGTNGGCSHEYSMKDDVGWVCENCGLVAGDIQSIFLVKGEDTGSKKQAASLAIANQLYPDDQDYQTLEIPREALSTVTLSVHPYYEENLHPHQKEGFTFLSRNLIGDTSSQSEPGGCILAHAPGTGKSCLTISFVQSFLTAFPKGRPLIVAPKIMLKPWQKEFALWKVEEVPIYNLNEIGKQGKRSSVDEEEKRANDCASAVSTCPELKERLEARRMKLLKKWLESRSVLLVSYNLFATLVLAGLNDEKEGSLKQQISQALLDGPELLILDEGHFPRTKRTQISQALMRVRTNRKLLLSGTLFQNNFRELFNLLKLARHNFMSLYPPFAAALKLIDENKPSSSEYCSMTSKTYNELDLVRREKEEQVFMENIGYKLQAFVQGADNYDEINLVLRKLRTLTSPIVHWYPGQILESLPGLFEFVVYVNLTAHQQQLYSRLNCKSSFEEKTRIAELCIHPALLKYEENLERLLSAPSTAHLDSQDPSKGVKTAFVFNLMRLCQISGERLLIFSQTLSPLSLIESMLTRLLGWSRGKEILRLDGTLQAEERQRIIEQFNQVNSSAWVMLASITACREGISLVGASRVIILDVLYNPSVVRQAVSRAFRIGQKKRVYVYRLVAANTKEEKIFQGAVQKDWLSSVLVDQSFRMSCNSFHADDILQVVGAPEDKILQKMLHTDACKRIHHVCRYRAKVSR